MGKGKKRLGCLILLLSGFGGWEGARAQESREELGREEIPAYLEEVRRQMAERQVRPEVRAEIVQEAGEALDRAAKGAATQAMRVERWGQAVGLIDEFLASEPDHPAGWNLAFQGAIYRWATGASWLGAWRLSPGDAEARKAAIEALEDALVRLRPLWTKFRDTPQGPMGQNIRFRLAQAASDRASLEARESPDAADLRRQALMALEPMPEDKSIAPFAALLKARLLVDAGRADEVEPVLERAEALAGTMKEGAFAPAREELLDVRIDLLLGRRSFPEAMAAVEAAQGISAAARTLRAVRVRAEHWISLFPGRERSEIELDAFRRAESLRQGGGPEARLALIALAGAILEPDHQEDPKIFELLAEGHLARGNSERAIALNLRGQEVARGLGKADLEWLLGYRAGAILYRLGQDERADEVLTPIAEAARRQAEETPADQRPKASLLQVLCRGRLAARGGRQAIDSHERSLRAHIESFPEDATSHEARFALAGLLFKQGKNEEALELFERIPLQSGRWLESRKQAARIVRTEVERLRSMGKLQEARRRMVIGREALHRYVVETEDPDQKAEVELLQVELELVPEVGTPKEVLELAETRWKHAVGGEIRERARLLWVACLALSGRYVDAEREVTNVFESAGPRDLLDLVVRLDQAGSLSPSDLVRRRLGYINRKVAGAVLGREAEVDASTVAEAKLWLGRGQLATGDLDGARRTLAGLSGQTSALPAELVEPYASALADLALFGEAEEAYRRLARLNPPGSRRWLEARYGLAISLYRGGKAEEARRLIEGTMALHPELGGGELQEKFLALRRRMEPKPSR